MKIFFQKHSNEIIKTFKISFLMAFLLISAISLNGLYQNNPEKNHISESLLNGFIKSDIEEEKKPNSAPGYDWTYKYGTGNINTYFPITLADGSLYVVGSELSATQDVYILSYPANSDYQWGLGTDDEEVRDVYLDSNEDIFMIGDRDNTVFFIKYDTDSNGVSNENEIDIGDDCWYMQMVVLPNSNYLILVKYIIGSDIGLRLYEINSNSLAIEWSKDFYDISTYYTNFEIDEELKYIQLTSTGKIVLVGQNKTDDGVFISCGDIGGSWTNKTILGNGEIYGCVIDQNDKIHLAIERENGITTEDELDIIRLTTDGVVETNCTFSSPTISYNVRSFIINKQSGSWNLPFLVYHLYGVETNNGIGYCFINGDSIETSNDGLYDPSSSYQYRLGGPTILESDIFLSIVEYGSSSGDVQFIRAGATSWVKDILYSYSEMVSVEDITMGANDDKVWIHIADLVEDAGIYSFNKNNGNIQDEISVGADVIFCNLLLHDKAGTDYIAMYGMEGDYVNYDADAVISIYDLLGNEIRREIREDTSGVNEFWEWSQIRNDGLYSVGLQTTSTMGEQTLIVGKYSVDFLFSIDMSLKKHEPINIYGMTPEVGSDGITRGSGTATDPFYIEFWEIENVGGPYAMPHGINIADRGEYFIIANCSISGFKNEHWAAGIAIHKTNAIKVLENNISDNNIGIVFASVTGNQEKIIEDNMITNSGNVGIQLDGSEWTCEYITITNNHIVGVDAIGSGDWDGVGLLLNGATQCEITYNKITDCAGYGIVISWEGTYDNTITHNDLCGNEKGGFNDLNKDYSNTIEDNECGLGGPFEISGFPLGLLTVLGIVSLLLIQRKILRNR